MTTCPKISDYQYPIASQEAEKIFQKGRALQKTEEAKPFDEQDHAEIVRLYTQAAKLGHWKAMNNLALLYKVGYFIPENEKIALELFKEMERLKVPEGYINMAGAYQEGLAGLSRSKKKYKKYLKKAAETGHPRSQFLYADSIDYLETEQEAMKWYRCALDQGYADAAFYLAIFEKTDGTEAKAFQYYRKGAMLGSSMCLSEMSDIYFYGLYGVEKDKERGICIEELGKKLRKDPSLTFPDLDKLCPASK